LINTSKDSIVLIIGGVSCYDALMRCEFILHAHIIAWTGDIPALSKIMNITGYNSYSGCRFCDIRGIYSQKHRHVYFPTKLKEKYVKKNHSSWSTYINEIETATTIKEKETLVRQYGMIIMMIICVITIINYLISVFYFRNQGKEHFI
jgi:hypothetical protein